MYNIAVCDDNRQFLETFEKLIRTNSEYEAGMICHKFISGGNLLRAEVENYDLIILDMQMDKLDGFSTAVRIKEKNKNAVLAFCSGVVMPQTKHFEVQPYRYLLKKMDNSEMQKNITDLLLEMKRRKKKDIVEVVNDGRAYRINIDNIIYVYRQKRGSVIVFEKNVSGNTTQIEELQSNEKLSEWYRQLSECGFEFAHTSYIVNMKKIISVEKDDIVMSSRQVLRVSRTCKHQFHERFSYYFSKKYRRGTEE